MEHSNFSEQAERVANRLLALIVKHGETEKVMSALVAGQNTQNIVIVRLHKDGRN